MMHMAASERLRLSVLATAAVLALPWTVGPGPRLRLSIDRDAYAAVVSTLSDGASPEHWFVIDTAIPLRNLWTAVVLSAPEWPRKSLPPQWADVPFSLRRELTRRFPIRYVRLPSDMFPAFMTVIDEAELMTMGRRDPRLVSHTLHVSRVLTTPDDLDAIVYYETYGQGDYVWLQRASPSQLWRVHKTLLAWVS
jgi:hypothetical protein